MKEKALALNPQNHETIFRTILKNKVFRNFSYLTVSSIFSQIISLFTVIKITKILSPNDYGLYTFLTVQGTLLLTIGDLGLKNIIIRTIAREPSRTNDLVVNGAILRLYAMFFFSLGYCLYNYLLGNLTPNQLILVILFSLISGASRLFETAFLGHEKMLPPAVMNLTFSIFWFAVIYLLPQESITIVSLFITFLLLNSFKAVIYFAILKYQNLLIGQVQNFKNSARNILKESWPYFALVLVMLPYSQLSNNFLDINSTSTEIGYFNLSDRLIGPISFILDFALIAIFPNLSALWIRDKEKFNHIVSEGFKYFMLISLLFCFFFSLFAKEAIELLFSTEYHSAVKVSEMRIWYIYLTYIDSFIGMILGAINKEKLILKLGIINGICASPILFFGSKFGSLGLSIAYIIAFGLFLILLWYIFKKITNIKPNHCRAIWILSIILFTITYTIVPHLTFSMKVISSIVIISAVTVYFKYHIEMK